MVGERYSCAGSTAQTFIALTTTLLSEMRCPYHQMPLGSPNIRTVKEHAYISDIPLSPYAIHRVVTPIETFHTLFAHIDRGT